MTRPEDTAIGVQMAASKRRRARIGAAVGALAGLGLMLLAVGVSVVMIRRKRSA